MKKHVTVMLSVCSVLLLNACLSAPAPVSDTAGQPEPVASVEPAAVPSDAAPGPSADPVSAAPEETASVASLSPEITAAEAPPASDSISDKIELPVPEGLVPSPPPGEKMITFYPEPDLFAAAPAQSGPAVTEPAAAPVQDKKATTEAPAVPKTVPAAVPAAVPAVPAAAEKPATEKTATEKTAAETKPSESEGGIWTSEPTAPSALPAEKGPALVPSRSVTVSAGQSLQVWYPGTGWVYLGDASTLTGLAYESRKLDKSDTLFLFKALKEGNYTLEFSKFDVLNDTFSEDALAVTVIASDKPRTAVTRAPDYRSASDGAVSKTAQEPASVITAAKTPPVSASFTDEPSLMAPAASPAGSMNSDTSQDDGAALLEAARASIAKGDPSGALASLDAFFARAILNLDEGWYLRGQAYEANGPTKNVKKALEAYNTLVTAFPESQKWKDADARIRYIHRFYLNIR